MVLTEAVHSLVQLSHHDPDADTSSTCTKVREPDTFDGTDPRKLRAFLIQCELNFQDCPHAFRTDKAKVTFAQSYQRNDPRMTGWMNIRNSSSSSKSTSVPHDPVGDAEHQLDHLSMKDGQHINKLPDRIKDEISQVGKPWTLGELGTLVQTIDGRYWEHKSEVARQTKTSGNQSSTSKSNSNNLSSKPAPSSVNPSTPAVSSSSSKGKTSAPNLKPQSDLSSKLRKDGHLTSEERKCHFNLKLCMFCGAAGHMAKDCRKSSSNVSKARAAKTSTLETQPEASTSEAKK
ncbi:hypothetical protein BDN67DRAFT_1017655 [Paxillus ammoniavirescens]|nr:hypothetical protein BDN67DRAFT_1017655 [Paxillus ammoniavirescens]